MPNPALSIIVPTRDTRDLTLACLASVGGGEGGAQLVVVDDGGRDGTADAVAERYPAATLLVNDRPTGFSAAANRGLSAATGGILLLLNSDTEVLPGGLPALLDAFRRHPRLGIAGGRLLEPDGTLQWSGGRTPTLPWLFAVASGLSTLWNRLPLYRRWRESRRGAAVPGDAGLRGVDWVSGAALAARREVWRQVGGLHEGFRFYAQDLDWCLRARAAGWQVGLVEGFRVVHHHGTTLARVEPAAQLGRQQPDLLWSDWVRWARRARDPAWARRAAAALTAGVRLRLLARRLTGPLHRRDARPLRRREDAVLAAALERLGEEARRPGENGG